MNESSPSTIEAEVVRRLRALHDEPEALLRRFDRNGDGDLDRDEWRVARAALRRDVVTERAEDGEGEVLHDRYRLVVPIGRGSQGRTTLAVDVESGDFVAVKELDFDQVEHWEAVELFDREAAILAGLDHPAIPRVVDSFHIGDERHFLVQEFIEGEPLSVKLWAGHLFDEDTLRSYADELLEIVTYLHSHSPPVIHRDIKPANVIERPDGRLALVDFGAAHGASTGAGIIGTTGYMAPEQLMGMAVEATDLYAIGATLVHLATSRHPFDLREDDLRLHWRRFANLSETFSDWIDRLVDPMPEERYTSAIRAHRMLKAIAGASTSGQTALVKPDDATEGTLIVANPPDGFVVRQDERGTHVDIPDTWPSRLVLLGLFLGFVGLTVWVIQANLAFSTGLLGVLTCIMVAFGIGTIPGKSRRAKALRLGEDVLDLRLADGGGVRLGRDEPFATHETRRNVMLRTKDGDYALARLEQPSDRQWLRHLIEKWRAGVKR